MSAVPSLPTSRVLTILVVDDDENLRKSIAGVLRTRGHFVVLADSLHTAMTIILLNPIVDLVLTDLCMPGGGVKLLQRVRDECVDGQAPAVVFMTGLNDVLDHEKAIALGAAAFMTKPFSSRYLDVILAAAYQEHTARA